MEKKKKRICNKKMMMKFQNKTKNQIEKEYKTICQKSFKKEENLINILIRTSSRPKHFKTCIKIKITKEKRVNI